MKNPSGVCTVMGPGGWKETLDGHCQSGWWGGEAVLVDLRIELEAKQTSDAEHGG